MADNSEALRRARRQEGRTKRQRATEVLQQMLEAGGPVTFPAVARRAGVSVSLLYSDRELASRIAEARDRQRVAGRDRAWRLPTRSLVSEQSLQVDLANAREQIRQLNGEISVLRDRVARSLGAEADLARGRLASPLLDQLEDRVADLEAENVGLRRQVRALEGELRELADTLEAARTANRDLMAEINRVPREGR